MPDLDCVVDAATLTIHTTHTTVRSSSLHEVSFFKKDDDTKLELAHPLSSNILSHPVQHITGTSNTSCLTLGGNPLQ
jgi:hypothetical protein